MPKLVKELKVTFSPKDIDELTGRLFELSFNDNTQETEIWEHSEVVGIYNNGIPKEIEQDILKAIQDEEEYKVIEYYARYLDKVVRRLIKPVKLRNGRNALEIELWVDL